MHSSEKSCRLSMVASATVMLFAGAAGAQTPPDEIKVTGVVRDFLSTHSDFGITPDRGYGHYAMNIGRTIASDARPSYVGGGFLVSDQFLDRDSNPIPPHLYFATRTVKIANAPTIAGSATVDTWDSGQGPYGGANVGPAPHFDVGAEMPTVTEPPMLLPSIGDVSYSGNTSTVLATDLHCNNLSINDGHRLRIRGPVQILVEGNLEMRDDGAIELVDASSSLAIYVKGEIRLQDAVVGSDTWEYWRIVIVQLSGDPIRIADGVSMYANLIAPKSTVNMPDQSDFYGQMTVADLNVSNDAGLHIDGLGFDMCGGALADEPGTPGGASSGGIASANSFDEWFHDSLGVNLSGQHTITLTRNGSGVYEYLDDAFFPVDNRLWGNEGAGHNYYFTYSFTVDFRYEACHDQFIEFEGADDAWVFIGDKLAMDLGGILPGTRQYVQLDRLEGLMSGEVYPLRFFYAQRNGSRAVFRMRSNLDFIADTQLQAVSAGFD